MNDLYDAAKPVRNATIAEVDRVLAGNPDTAVRDAHHLGVHLASILIAWSADRFRTNSIVSHDLHDVFAIACGHALNYVAVNFRPINDGRPVSPTVSGQLFMQKVAQSLFMQIGMIEAGQMDFTVPFARMPDGSVQPQSFDFRDHLNKGT